MTCASSVWCIYLFKHLGISVVIRASVKRLLLRTSPKRPRPWHSLASSDPKEVAWSTDFRSGQRLNVQTFKELLGSTEGLRRQSDHRPERVPNCRSQARESVLFPPLFCTQ